MSNSTVLAVEKCNLARQEIEMILKSHGVSLAIGKKGDFYTLNLYKDDDGAKQFAMCDRFLENLAF